jgi:hypothetical protein
VELFAVPGTLGCLFDRFPRVTLHWCVVAGVVSASGRMWEDWWASTVGRSFDLARSDSSPRKGGACCFAKSKCVALQI